MKPYRNDLRSWEPALSLALGTAFAAALFFGMAFSQLLGEVEPPKSRIDEAVAMFDVPDIEEIEEEPPPPEEAEEVPELEEADAPQLSLDQLDIALNVRPGAGAIAGEFSLAGFGQSLRRGAGDLDTSEFVDFMELDRIPRPIGVSGFNFPRRLRKQKAEGRIVLLLKLDESGDVLDVQLYSSSLPAFDAFVLRQVKSWKFTPPTQKGKPVKAKARLPIPIRIS